MSLSSTVNVRSMTKADLNFIINSSVECLSTYTESLFKGWTIPNIKTYLNTLILVYLHKADYSVLVACLNEDSDLILAYCIVENASNHVALQYTKYNYRKLGIQKHLLMPLLIDFNKPITVNWQTREMLKLAKDNKVEILNRMSLSLLRDIEGLT